MSNDRCGGVRSLHVGRDDNVGYLENSLRIGITTQFPLQD